VIYNKDKNYAFFHIPKTAGQSILTALGYETKQRVPPNAGYHTIPKTFVEKLEIKKFDKIFSFAFVRNPWERMHSMYHYICKSDNYKTRDYIKHYRSMGFNNWMVEECANFCKSQGWYNGDYIFQQVDWVTYNNKLISFVGRYENLDGDFKFICDKINHPYIKLPHVHKTKKPDYHNEYNSNAYNKIVELFSKDIETFNYEF